MRGAFGNANGRRGRPRKDGLPHGAPTVEVVKPPKSPSKRNGSFLDKFNPATRARELALQHVDMAINALVESASQTVNINARVRAATELLDRACGKPHLMLEQKELPPTTQVKISFGEQAQPVLLPPLIDGEDVDN